ncbi:probable ATP-dependent RNA helicase DDX58 [Python bivittatus]|uniref:RNA helicase n=1 Tax=Python bivittatus TaxID=176946 RepID=A0A9F3QTK3_PYTBI|nr:probable ATP-dependent RNA helicase DDX58 [Python bivittatus]
MTDVERENLLRCRKYIVKTLNPAYILSYMKTWLSDETVEKIQEQSDRPTMAAEFFLQSVVELSTDGWFRGFLDALKAAGYSGLYQAIENWDFKIIENLEPHRELLKRIEPTLQDIDIKEVHYHMRKCLLDQEWEEILQVRERKGRKAGASKLVDCLCRSDKEDWPETFHQALDATKYKNQRDLWNLKGDDNADVEMANEDEGSCVFKILQFSEEAESDNLCGSSPLNAFQQTTGIPWKARSYQIELAEPALNGKNTMICAPTGSGKTFVSIMICEHHLCNRPAGQEGKVVFLTPKVPVYEQQKKVFHEYFKNNYSVAGVCGENASLFPADMVIKGNDIIVMTPQNLLNSLNNETLPSLSIFTLMIFDECHNTTGNNPYNMLMFKYLDLKLEQSGIPLPQIVGLTASPGIGTAKKLDEAIEHICKFCASLDIGVISTVRKNTKDLEEIVHKPEKIIRLVGNRPQSHFVDIVSQMMSKVEDLARQFYPIDTLSKLKSHCYGTQSYEQWIVNVQKNSVVLQLPNKEEESRICKALFICTEHLRKYNDALIINEDARTKDALVYLKDFFEDTKNGKFDYIERQLASNFEVKLPELTAASQDESNENPKLEDLAEILGEAYHFNPETRTILFVKTRALLAALKNWVEETPELKHLKPETLMGRGKRNQHTGMTLPNQKVILDDFKTNGDSKLLIATSVADEGIDIPQCNLVLLYEYTGNIIKMIQVRGRGRAKDSKCILVTSKKELEEKERYNLQKEEMMIKAIEVVQSWDEKKFVQKISALQKMQKVKKKLAQPKPWINNRVLLCGRCKKYACSTENLRVIEDSHHTVLDEEFRTRYKTEPHKKKNSYGNFEKKCKMHCVNCHHDWGITVKYKVFEDIPIIKIESFSVQDVVSNKQFHFRKWRDVDFAMKDFDIDEMPE